MFERLPAGADCLRVVQAMLLGAAFLIAGNEAKALTDIPPQRANGNLIAAVYNIQWLGERPHDLDKVAQAIQHFDVCGIVEIKDEGTLSALVGL